MPVVNDVPGAYERIRARADQLAAQLGIQREVLYGFFNDHARFPANLGELEQWGSTPDRIYGIVRRDPTTGAWRPIMPGTNPMYRPGGDPETDRRFSQITNAEDADIQRFQDWHPEILSQPTPTGAGGTTRSAQSAPGAAQVATGRSAAANPYAGTPYAAAWEMANPAGGATSAGKIMATPEDIARARQAAGMNPSAQAMGGAPSALPSRAVAATAQGASSTGIPAVDQALQNYADAAAYGNTQDLQARINEAANRYAVARTDQERQLAYLDLQRWQAELAKVQFAQTRYDQMARALLEASVQLSSQPKDYFRFNQYTSGGRDIFAQMSQAGPAFSGPTGPVEPGSVDDLLRRLGIGPAPATPATPSIVQPGAGLPSIPGLPGSVGGGSYPSAGGGGGGGGGGGSSAGLPSYEEMLRGLDAAAGGTWGGDRANRDAVKSAWWNADPARRNQPVPSW